MFQFKEIQKAQLTRKGISESEVLRQLECFRVGMQYARLNRPATAGDGILVFDEKQCNEAKQFFQQHIIRYDVIKFVPASGAATRMFKDLFGFLETEWPLGATLDQLPEPVQLFAREMHQMPFYHDLKNAVNNKYPETEHPDDVKSLRHFVEVMLTEDGLHLGALPKALIPFHRYGEEARLAFEEHLVEWASLIPENQQPLSIHFTLSPAHIEWFESALKHKLPIYKERFGRTYEISYSVQAETTDTLAATADNLPFLQHDDTLLFRPGGHGALLYNLNRLDADIVHIKNIDNVCSEEIELQNLEWKRILGGLLLQVRERTTAILEAIDRGVTAEELQQSSLWIQETFNHRFSSGEDSNPSIIREFLHRPIRVCGMVKNTGEPGGGPFWTEQRNGGVSLQIIESAQVSPEDPGQKAIAASATHFNPVDLVCSITDYKRNRFDLNKYADPETAFISTKSHQGKVLKALEHPGLWNGAMANWLTLFVEVPLITFNPVKTVNDLLRDEHQPEKNNRTD